MIGPLVTCDGSTPPRSSVSSHIPDGDSVADGDDRDDRTDRNLRHKIRPTLHIQVLPLSCDGDGDEVEEAEGGDDDDGDHNDDGHRILSCHIRILWDRELVQ